MAMRRISGRARSCSRCTGDWRSVGTISTRRPVAKSRCASGTSSRRWMPRASVSVSALAKTSAGLPGADLLQQHPRGSEAQPHLHARTRGLEGACHVAHRLGQAGVGGDLERLRRGWVQAGQRQQQEEEESHLGPGRQA